MEAKQEENHFKFPNMHLVRRFHGPGEQFGEIPMFSTEVGETAHRQQIQERY